MKNPRFWSSIIPGYVAGLGSEIMFGWDWMTGLPIMLIVFGAFWLIYPHTEPRAMTMVRNALGQPETARKASRTSNKGKDTSR